MVNCEADNVLLKAANIKKYFPVKEGIFFLKNIPKYIKAVDDVSFSVYKGETLGLVGESGCGKSTLIRTIIRLLEPTEGEIIYKGNNITHTPAKNLRELRKEMQIVFQDPFSSLHPKMKIREILKEPLIINKIGNNQEKETMIREIIEKIGLKEEHLDRYPFEFSGGQRQRIVIARALITNPSFVVLDEPVSALDVSIRSQILNMLELLQKDFNLTYLFISHDLSVVEHICDRIMVMYLGRVVEVGSRKQIFENPRHPYTKALLSAIPKINPDDRSERIVLSGEIPSPINPPAGCSFKTRCMHYMEKCNQTPAGVKKDNHFVLCHLCQ
jgi:oligopeptide/dipeptide ABC transporter ATP-binding protein